MKNRIQQQDQTGKAAAKAGTVELFRPLREDRGTPDKMLSALIEEEHTHVDHDGCSAFVFPTTYIEEECREKIGKHALLGESNLYRWQGLFVTGTGQLAERASTITGEFAAYEDFFRPITDVEAREFLLAHCPLIARLFGTPEGEKA